MTAIRRVAVYCGARSGEEPVFAEAARRTGRALAGRGIGIVYGAGRVGLMGELADAALAAGGHVTGVIPTRLVEHEVAHDGLTERIEVDGMHARKAAMSRLADAFIALPGGFGTLDEVFEATTWTQLGYHKKAVGLLNVAGYFDPLLRFLEGAASRGFIAPAHAEILRCRDDIDALLDALEAGPPVPQFPPGIKRP